MLARLKLLNLVDAMIPRDAPLSPIQCSVFCVALRTKKMK